MPAQTLSSLGWLAEVTEYARSRSARRPAWAGSEYARDQFAMFGRAVVLKEIRPTTPDGAWTTLVRCFGDVGRHAAFAEIARQREVAGDGCRNDLYRCTWCTCCR